LKNIVPLVHILTPLLIDYLPSDHYPLKNAQVLYGILVRYPQADASSVEKIGVCVKV